MIRIFLIGYMGAGKTTLGKAFARAMGLSFVDLDWYIEERFHKTVGQIFSERGEDGFRELEKRMLHEAGDFEDVVISVGGGTPCFFDNMDYMNQQGSTIYLKAEPHVLQAHLKMGKTIRPLIQGKSPEELDAFIRESLTAREPFYSKAKHTIDIDIIERREQILHYVNLIKEHCGI